jgi:hypothetical protein
LNFTRLDKLNSKLPHRRYMIRKKNAWKILNYKNSTLNFWGHVTLWQKLKSAALSFLLKIWETIAGWTEYSFEW